MAPRLYHRGGGTLAAFVMPLFELLNQGRSRVGMKINLQATMASNSPFQRPGSTSPGKHDLNTSGTSPPAKMIMDVFWVQWRILTLPWQVSDESMLLTLCLFEWLQPCLEGHQTAKQDQLFLCCNVMLSLHITHI